jgi:hypothetical protein
MKPPHIDAKNEKGISAYSILVRTSSSRRFSLPLFFNQPVLDEFIHIGLHRGTTEIDISGEVVACALSVQEKIFYNLLFGIMLFPFYSI